MILFPLFGYDDFAKAIHQALSFPIGKLTIHTFPDEEIKIKIDSTIANQEIILIGSLDRPNIKIAPLIFAAKTAREMKVAKIGLITPYLPYMRQDKQFQKGESITSKYFAEIIANTFDWLFTIDPHLHRWHSLSDLYKIHTMELHTSDLIAHWIEENVAKPLLIGPDSESQQWVSSIAEKVNAPFLILEKKRVSDDVVLVSIPKINLYRDHTPVLVDDIISTAKTMIATIKHLKTLKTKPAICIGIHAIFADNAYQNLLQEGAERIVTCNTIHHISNEIDVKSLMINGLKDLK